MRKFIVLLMAAVLCLNLGIGAWAAEGTLSVPDVQVKKDQTVYVPVILNESVTGDSLGVSYSYDKAVLEAIPDSATWGRQGMLQDFSRNDSGVWALGEAADLKGTVCVLAFRVKDGVELTSTQVTVNVTVKNDADTVGTYTATGTLYTVCDHSYGNWESSGPVSHSRKCVHCDQPQVQSHNWDAGVVTDHPTDSHKDLKTYTCQDCKETRVEEIANQGDLPVPPTVPELPTEAPTEPEYVTRPPETEPPATKPTEHKQEQTKPAPTQAPTEAPKPTAGQQGDGKEPTTGKNPGNDLTDFNNPGGQNGSKDPATGPNTAPTVPAPTESDEEQTRPGEPTEAPEATAQDPHAQEPTERPAAVTMPATEAPEVTQIIDHYHEESLPTEEAIDHDHDHDHGEPVPQVTGTSVLALGAAAVLLALAVVIAVVLGKRNKRK